MTVSDITSRIAQIQSQLALLGPSNATGAGAAFAAALSAAGTTTTGTTTAASTSATDLTGTTGTTGGSVDGRRAVDLARTYVGMPYVWGGSSPAAGGMDCSGLVQYVYGQLGVDLPRLSADQARSGQAVASIDEAQPGDLLAWDNSSRNNGADHIAIYMGDGKMIEAPRTGLDIRIVDVPSTPDYIRRVAPADTTSAITDTSSVAATAATAAAAAAAAAGAARTTPAMSTTAGAAGVADVPYGDLFAAAGAKYGLDPSLLAAVARQESGFDASAVSPAGAQGLMQLMPATAKGLGVTDSFDPAQAVDGAAQLLRDLLDRFGRVDYALAGYNAGPGAVLRYDGVPPYPETRNYVSSILSSLAAA